MILPDKAIIIKRDEAQEIPQSGLILSTKTTPKDTGTIMYAAPEQENFKGMKVKFRESFIEDIDVYGEKLIYVRDWSQGVYFID